MNFPNRAIVERIKNEYPAGTRVELVSLNDPFRSLEKGSLGTVLSVDDIGTIHVSWDNGGSLGIAYGEDSCRKVNEWYKVCIVEPGTDGDPENGMCEPDCWYDMVLAANEEEAVRIGNIKAKEWWETEDCNFPSPKEMGAYLPVCSGAERVTAEEYEAWKEEMESFPEPPFN